MYVASGASFVPVRLIVEGASINRVLIVGHRVVNGDGLDVAFREVVVSGVGRVERPGAIRVDRQTWDIRADE